MKSTQLPLIKSIVDQMVGVCRELSSSTTNDPVPVILRVSKGSGDTRCVQIVTTVGVVTIVDDGKLTELDYPVLDIGTPDNWSKVSKGVITTKSDPLVVPVARAAGVAAFADPEVDISLSLLSSSSVLPPSTVIYHPGNMLVFSESDGKALVWAYNSSGQRTGSPDPYEELATIWTKSPIPCEPGLYGVVRAWHRAVAYTFPKDPQTGQPTKIDGVAFSRIGGHAGIRLVSRELGIVVSMACSRLPDKYAVASYRDSNNRLVVCSIQDNYHYNIQTNNNTKIEGKTMEVKMIDISQVKAKPAAAAAVPAVEPPVSTDDVPVTEPSPQPVSAAVEPVKSDNTEPAGTVQVKDNAPSKTTDELLQEALNMCAEVGTVLKAVQSAVRAAVKSHKQDIKELKSNAKESEELTKLRAAHRRLKALLLESED